MLRFGHQYSCWVYNLTLHQPQIFLLFPSTRLHVLKYFIYQNRMHYSFSWDFKNTSKSSKWAFNSCRKWLKITLPYFFPLNTPKYSGKYSADNERRILAGREKREGEKADWLGASRLKEPCDESTGFSFYLPCTSRLGTGEACNSEPPAGIDNTRQEKPALWPSGELSETQETTRSN